MLLLDGGGGGARGGYIVRKTFDHLLESPFVFSKQICYLYPKVKFNHTVKSIRTLFQKHDLL